MAKMFKEAIQKVLIGKFEQMRNLAELKALSNVSLERPLSELEFNRMRELKGLVL